jgi:hypothetical protein
MRTSRLWSDCQDTDLLVLSLLPMVKDTTNKLEAHSSVDENLHRDEKDNTFGKGFEGELDEGQRITAAPISFVTKGCEGVII